jgi:hypothetical protein
MFWLLKVEGGKQLHFSRFDESFHDFAGKTIHSPIDLKDSKFSILDFRLFEGWP